MAKTVLITGASSGIGRATALYFQEKGWNVAACMRNPGLEKELNTLSGVICPQLEITNPEDIHDAVRKTVKSFSTIDVLINNAGYGLLGPFESATEKEIRRQVDTNLMGVVRVTRAVLPYMRAQRSGVVVNISSNAGRMSFPYYGYYNATKFAVEGLSEALSHELSPFNIRVKVIEPGPVDTDFFTRSAVYAKNKRITAYDAGAARVLSKMHSGNRAFRIPPASVAALIFRVSADTSPRLRYPAGLASHVMLCARGLLPDGVILPMIRKVLVGKGNL